MVAPRLSLSGFRQVPVPHLGMAHSRVAAFGAALALAGLAAPAAAQCLATQVRLSLTADATQMGVSWATPNTTTPADYAGVVSYGTSPGNLDCTTLPGDSRNYTLCNRSSPFLHFAVMTGLAAGAQYWYSISEPRCGAPTPPTNFSAVHPVGSKPYPFTIAVYGDMGISYSQDTARFLTDRTAARGVDLVLHAGDISCACVGDLHPWAPRRRP